MTTFAATTRLLNAFGQGFAQVESKFPAAPCLIFIGTEGHRTQAGPEHLAVFGKKVVLTINQQTHHLPLRDADPGGER